MKPRNNNYDQDWSEKQIEELEELEDFEMERSVRPFTITDEDEALERERERLERINPENDLREVL